MAGLNDIILWPFKDYFKGSSVTDTSLSSSSTGWGLSDLFKGSSSFSPQKVTEALNAVSDITTAKPQVTGLFDANVLAKLIAQEPTEEERKRVYKQAIGSLLGSALAGLIGSALIGGRAGDIFGAGAVTGGMGVANYLLEQQLEKEKQWQNFKNQLATKLITLNLDYLADTLKDERKAEKYRMYSEKLKEIYPQFVNVDDKGNAMFDFTGFSHAATIIGLQMGLDPNQFKEIKDAFTNALETINKLEESKWKILKEKEELELTKKEKEALAKKYEAQAELYPTQAEYYKQQAEWIKKGRPEAPRVIIHKGTEGEGSQQKINSQKILQQAITLAQKDLRWQMATTPEQRQQIINEYYNQLTGMLGGKTEEGRKTSSSTKKPVTLQQILKLLP